MPSNRDTLEEMLVELAGGFRRDPGEALIVPERVLVASVRERTGLAYTPREIRAVLEAQEDGTLADACTVYRLKTGGSPAKGKTVHDERLEKVYEAVVHACTYAAQLCFGVTPEGDDVDLQLSWVDGDDGGLCAAICRTSPDL